MGKSNRKSEGQFLPLPYSQIKSLAWRSLSGNAVRLWLEIHTRFNGSNNGRLTLSFAEAADTLGLGKASIQRAYRELEEKGFLALEKRGNWYSRRAHEWRLTTKPTDRVKGRQPPTCEWRSWRPPKTERGSRSDPSASSVVPQQNRSSVLGSRSEPVEAFSEMTFGSETEH